MTEKARFGGPFLLALPVLGLLLQFWMEGLPANPVETITHTTGIWALNFLFCTLAITPLRRWLGWNRLAQYRRLLGLGAFGYAVAHLLTYLVFDAAFSLTYIWEDVAKRRYVTAGFAAFLLLFPLAVTSTRSWIRRLGRRWKQLHRLIYPAAVLAVAHFWWKEKADISEPLVYALILVVLLVARLPRRRRKIARVNTSWKSD